MPKRTNRINCLDRALDILETVAQAREIGVSELARKLNLHVATTYNLLKTLALRNYLMNINGRYRPGPLLESLSAAWNSGTSLNLLLDPFVHELSLATGERSVASILTGFQAKIIISHEGSQHVSVNFMRTICNPLELATGRILVAFGPEELWKEFVSRYLKSCDTEADDHILSNEAWLKELRGIRSNGFSEIRRPGISSVSALAAPVANKNGVVTVSIGVSCPNIRVSAKHIDFMKKELIKQTQQASRMLGGAGR